MDRKGCRGTFFVSEARSRRTKAASREMCRKRRKNPLVSGSHPKYKEVLLRAFIMKQKLSQNLRDKRRIRFATALNLIGNAAANCSKGAGITGNLASTRGIMHLCGFFKKTGNPNRLIRSKRNGISAFCTEPAARSFTADDPAQKYAAYASSTVAGTLSTATASAAKDFAAMRLSNASRQESSAPSMRPAARQ